VEDQELEGSFQNLFLDDESCSVVCGVLVWTCGPEFKLIYLNNLELDVLVFSFVGCCPHEV
jgi:hypothetical protein